MNAFAVAGFTIRLKAMRTEGFVRGLNLRIFLQIGNVRIVELLKMSSNALMLDSVIF